MPGWWFQPTPLVFVSWDDDSSQYDGNKCNIPNITPYSTTRRSSNPCCFIHMESYKIHVFHNSNPPTRCQGTSRDDPATTMSCYGCLVLRFNHEKYELVKVNGVGMTSHIWKIKNVIKMFQTTNQLYTMIHLFTMAHIRSNKYSIKSRFAKYHTAWYYMHTQTHTRNLF